LPNCRLHVPIRFLRSLARRDLASRVLSQAIGFPLFVVLTVKDYPLPWPKTGGTGVAVARADNGWILRSSSQSTLQWLQQRWRDYRRPRGSLNAFVSVSRTSAHESDPSAHAFAGWQTHRQNRFSEGTSRKGFLQGDTGFPGSSAPAGCPVVPPADRRQRCSFIQSGSPSLRCCPG
jgi:hypothetical protein